MARRRSISRAQRVRIFDDAKGVCIHCGLKIHAERGEKWHVGHVIALALGGKDEPENMGPAHDRCNMEDAWNEVIPKKAKADRVRANHLGIKKQPKGRGFQRTYKGRPIKQKVDGTIVDRETGEPIR